MTAPEGVICLVSGPRSYLGKLWTWVPGLVRRHEPDLPVRVLSSYGIRKDLRVDHVPCDNDLHPLQQKVDILARSPHERTLFSDTDTTVLAPIRPVIDYLDANGFAGARASLADDSVRPPRWSAMTDVSAAKEALHRGSVAARQGCRRLSSRDTPISAHLALA